MKAAGGLLAPALVCLLAPVARGQVSSYANKQMGQVSDQAPPVLDRVKVKQRLNAQVPLDAEFRDESGKTVRLGDYFGKKPVVLSLVYFQCKMVCPEEINGLVSALEMVKFVPGRDFDVVFVSFDPAETPEIAAREKAVYLKRYGHPETANGWHFLTGQQPAINAVSSSVGFQYARVPGPDGQMSQFAHASAIEILTAEGKIAQYYLGVEYPPNDLRLGLVEASAGKIGSPVDAILTYCYRYDPQLNRHSLVIARVVQLGCLVTVFGLGGYMTMMFRRDVERDRKYPNG
ncbi:MAG: SCO family protein [Silvibacterium sp.]|nr:SCO family protein [Silvibacterium sp.]MBV8437102.1 SCO family protein [Silvibacterium sp.]